MRRRLDLWGAAVLSIAAAVTGCDNDPGFELPAEKRFEIILERAIVEFAFDQSKDMNFEVAGEGAVDLRLPEISVPDGWDHRIVRFEKDTDGESYLGTVRVTAPRTETSGTMQISVTNGNGTREEAAARISAVPDPLEIYIHLPDGPLRFGLSELRRVPFNVTYNNPALMTAAISATDQWSAKLERFSPDTEDGLPTGYTGSILVGAPDVESSSEIVVIVANEAGEVVGSAKLGVLCERKSDPDLDITIEITEKHMNFAFHQSRTTEFRITGEDAKDLTASVEPPEGWTSHVTFFEEYSYGYSGVLSITSPSAESAGAVVLRMTCPGGEVLGVIDVSSCPGGLKFGEDSYEFDIYEYRTINYTVSGTKGRTVEKAEIIHSGGWYVDYSTEETRPSLDWDEERDIYTGSFRLRSGAYPENAVVTVRLTDSRDYGTTDWPVDVVCGGGPPVPDPKPGANCIVVSGAGTVSFDARKGDGTPVAGSSVKWIWADREGLIGEGSPVYEAGKITFDTAPSFAQGNMLMGLFDSSGAIVWSWHIWFVSDLNLDAAPGKFMNMPLGAFSATRTDLYGTEDVGLLYQWGRKEPFPGMKDKLTVPEEPSGAFLANTKPTVTTGGHSWGITTDRLNTHGKAAGYPTKMAVMVEDMPSSGRELWSATADPCPKGWRVPTRKELQEYWAYHGSGGSHTGFSYDGIIPDKHRGEWWSVTGLRAANIGSGGSRQGALILNAGLYYWSCECNGRYSPPDPEEPFSEEGYVYASSITNLGSHMAASDMRKSDAMSVRCIKE